MRTRQFVVKANETLDIAVNGDYLRVRSSPVDLFIQSDQEADGIEISEGEHVKNWPFKSLRVSHTSATPQTIKLTIGKGASQDSAKVGGEVSIAGQQGATPHGRASVTNANQILLAANANRKFLMIQNNDGSATLRVRLDGVAATAAQGIRLAPGDSMTLDNFAPTGAINACMESASVAVDNVEFVEG